MSVWDRDSFDEALRACWDDDEDAVEHCLAMITPALLPALQPDATVVDFGCGVGRLLGPFARAWPETTWCGVDTSPKMRGHARAELAALGNVYVTDEIPQQAAAAYSMLVFQHLDRMPLQTALEALYRALRPGGVLRFQFVHEGGPGDEGPFSRPFHSDALRVVLAAAGFVGTAYDLDERFPSWTWCTTRKAG